MRDEINKFKVGAPARVGLVAPNDVVVPLGNTGLDPSQTSFFQARAPSPTRGPKDPAGFVPVELGVPTTSRRWLCVANAWPVRGVQACHGIAGSGEHCAPEPWACCIWLHQHCATTSDSREFRLALDALRGATW